MEDNLHWYAFSFTWANETGFGNANAYSGFTNNFVTYEATLNAKKVAGAPENSVLISVSYLGRMTRQEFKPEEE